MGVLRQARAILLLPVTMALVAPGAIIAVGNPVRIGWSLPRPLSVVPAILGLALVGLGLALVYRTIRLLAVQGRGTLAPWDPTQRLVVQGVYRHVRNPMITGVWAILLGEAIFLGSPGLLYWFLGFAVVNCIYIPLLEEPGLERRFGEDYQLYKQHVPRWIPRRQAWYAPWGDEPR